MPNFNQTLKEDNINRQKNSLITLSTFNRKVRLLIHPLWVPYQVRIWTKMFILILVLFRKGSGFNRPIIFEMQFSFPTPLPQID